MLDESLRNLSDIYTRTNKNLVTIMSLLEKGEAKISNNMIKINNDIDVKTIYANGSSVSIAKFFKQGARYPSHCHENIIEYLICTKGSFGVSFEGGYRIVKYTECVSIPKNSLHSATSLEKDSELLGICLPSDVTYKRSMECQEK